MSVVQLQASGNAFRWLGRARLPFVEIRVRLVGDRLYRRYAPILLNNHLGERRTMKFHGRVTGAQPPPLSCAAGQALGTSASSAAECVP